MYLKGLKNKRKLIKNIDVPKIFILQQAEDKSTPKP